MHMAIHYDDNDEMKSELLIGKYLKFMMFKFAK